MAYLEPNSLGSVESDYRDAFASGKDSPAALVTRCTGYGITSAKHGTSWDDICIGHEFNHKLGPVYGLPKKKGVSPAVVIGIGAAALLAIHFSTSR